MKIYRIFIKSLKEQVRDWRTLGTSFFLPVMFMVIFGWAMGSSYYTYKIFLLDNDKGITGENGKSIRLGPIFIQKLEDACYEDGTKIFRLKPVSTREGTAVQLQKHQAAALVTIPEQFSRYIAGLPKKNETGVPGVVFIDVEGDPAYPAYSLVKMMFDAVLGEFISEKTGVTPPVQGRAVYMGAKRQGSEFDYIAPGLMLFAIFMLIFQVSMVLVKETEQKTLHRLLLAPVRARDLLLGVSLTQAAFAVLMIPLMLASAVAVGFHSQGSLLNGMVIGVFASFSAIALGLWVAAFSRTANQAFLISNAILVPVVFLSGVFFPLPKIPLFTLGERTFSIFDIQPATHAVNAFSRVFLYGASLGELMYELTMLVLLSTIFFISGLALWKRMHVKRFY